MSKSISVANAIELARIESNTAYLALLDVDVVDPITGMVVETLHLARNPESFTYNGSIYEAVKFDIQLKAEIGKQAEVQLTITDYSQAVIERMEQYDGGIGFGVTLTIQNADMPNSPPELVESFEVVGAEAAGYIVTFNLGAVNALADAFPRRTQTRDFCQWRYKENLGCKYGTTALTFVRTTAGTSGYMKGTSVPIDTLNKPVVGSLFVGGMTIGQTFTVELRDAGNSILANGLFTPTAQNVVSFNALSGSLGWEKLDSDVIRVWVRSAIGIASAQKVSLFVYPSTGAAATSQDGISVGCFQIEIDVIQPTQYENNDPYYKAPTLVRNKLTGSNSIKEIDGWVFSNALVDETVTGPFGPNVGPLSTCDYTLKGSNGCEFHGNSLNFGAYHGLNANNVRYS